MKEALTHLPSSQLKSTKNRLKTQFFSAKQIRNVLTLIIRRLEQLYLLIEADFITLIFIWRVYKKSQILENKNFIFLIPLIFHIIVAP